MGDPKTLVELLQAAAGERVAVVAPETGEQITYEGLRRRVRAMAGALAGMGISRGDRVAMALPNGISTIVSFLAASVAGTAAPLNPAYRYEEFCFYLEDTAAKLLIVPIEGAQEARRAASDRGIPIVTPENLSTGSSRAMEPAPDDIALVLHTSGSTGRPKRVPLKHRNLAVSVRNVVHTYQLSPGDVSLCLMPLFHVHGLVRDRRVTWYSAVPTIHQLILQRPAGEHNLRFIRSCSAALSPEVMDKMESAFGAPVLEAYGMTEASHQMASNPLPPAARKPGSVGHGTGVRISIMDSAGRHVKPGGLGEVVIQGPNVIDGYENNPEANAKSFVQGWFRTGDQGVLDAEGYLRLTGRIKELINRGGEKIAPQEIDDILLTHPAVAEAVCFGVPHPAWGEEVAAAVVLREPVTEPEILAWCRERLADFKCPKKLHIVKAIPRTATGKIQRLNVAASFSGVRT
jgi:acyl-CoA synthetase (AMP-forming)/AMP-acid ligase II